MRIARAVPNDGTDAVYVRVKNNSSTTLTNGDVVVWDTTDNDGISVTTTNTPGNARVAGVIAETIPAGGYGAMQVYGFHPAVKVDGGTTDVPANAVLGTGSAHGYAFTTSTVGAVLGIALEAVTTQGTGKVFIRCM